MVVYDLWEMLASTYGRIITPHAINLSEAEKKHFFCFCLLPHRKENSCSVDLRHDARQMEDLSGEVSHVAVEEDEQGLDDSSVRGEARGKSSQEAVNGSHQDTSQ